MILRLNTSVTDHAIPLFFVFLFCFCLFYSSGTPWTQRCAKTSGLYPFTRHAIWCLRLSDARSPVWHEESRKWYPFCQERQPPGACANSSLCVCLRTPGTPPAGARMCFISCLFACLWEVCSRDTGPERLSVVWGQPLLDVLRWREVACFPYGQTPTFPERHLCPVLKWVRCASKEFEF